MLVTSELTAVHRTIFEALRTFFIWIVDLIIYQIDEDFGENWDNWSFMQLAGFLILVCAMLIYNRVIKLPHFRYPDIDEKPEEEQKGDDEEKALLG